MANDSGPIASTLDTMIDKPSRSEASAKACSAASTVSASVTCSAPAFSAIPARSVPVPVAVGNPPTDNRLSLSNIQWVKFGGR